MNALHKSAKQVDQAWCKTSLRRDAKDDNGDRFCAVGALINSMTLADGLELDWDTEKIGTPEELDYYSSVWHGYFRGEETDDSVVQYLQNSLPDVYDYINKSLEGKILAEAIIENFRDRLLDEMVSPYSEAPVDEFLVGEEALEFQIENGMWAQIVYQFNDHDDTTREEVIAMMEKAGNKLDELVEFEDSELEALVEEVKELINA